MSKKLATELSFKPRTRKILAHLQRGLTISPAEAQTVYSVWRLAAAIHELRKEGYKIITHNRRDMMGHRYARYELVDA